MVYLRFFVVMLISWTIYIAFNTLKYHVVTCMNVLHILALLSTLNSSEYDERQIMLDAL